MASHSLESVYVADNSRNN
ncbi:hypothetical protein [Salinisphaera sp. T31B1]